MKGYNILPPTEAKECPDCMNKMVNTEAGFFCIFCYTEFFECVRCLQIYRPEGIATSIPYCWQCLVDILHAKMKKHHRRFRFRVKWGIRLAQQKAIQFPPLRLGPFVPAKCSHVANMSCLPNKHSPLVKNSPNVYFKGGNPHAEP